MVLRMECVCQMTDGSAGFLEWMPCLETFSLLLNPYGGLVQEALAHRLFVSLEQQPHGAALNQD